MKFALRLRLAAGRPPDEIELDLLQLLFDARTKSMPRPDCLHVHPYVFSAIEEQMPAAFDGKHVRDKLLSFWTSLGPVRIEPCRALPVFAASVTSDASASVHLFDLTDRYRVRPVILSRRE